MRSLLLSMALALVLLVPAEARAQYPVYPYGGYYPYTYGYSSYPYTSAYATVPYASPYYTSPYWTGYTPGMQYYTWDWYNPYTNQYRTWRWYRR